jgi:glucoside 3-dehydrogenase (cytochrome c) hitch-hiker subunit
MNRREAVKTTGVLLGGVLITSAGLLTSCSSDARTHGGARVLNANDETLMEEIADTLLPNTVTSPGAKAAGVGQIINLLLTDCYDADAQLRVVNGLKEFRETVGDHFASMSQVNREDWLRRIDTEAKARGNEHYFTLMRELSLRAYFSSEIGMTKALRYVLVPGRWVGCVPLAPGQPAWA